MWNTTWDLKPGIDPKRFPSSGPYKIDSVADNGSVVLVANDRWWGAKPLTNRITVWPRGIDVQDRVNDGTFDVVDVATGSSGTLTTPDDYERADSPSGGIEQLIFAPQGPLAAPPARRAVALCTPRDLIARNAGLPISDSRLNPASDNALSQAEAIAEAGQFGVANPDAARAALGNKPLTVRIGYQTPNARLAATVGAIAKACAPAGITVQDVASDTTSPQTLRDGRSTCCSAASAARRAAGRRDPPRWTPTTLFTGNGNNLPAYANGQIDGVISALAVTVDPKEQARLIADGAPVLWGDMPTLPLYRQQRTLLMSKKMYRSEQQPDPLGCGLEHGPLEPGEVSTDR